MKVVVENGKIILDFEGYRKTENERAFLSEVQCYEYHLFEKRSDGGKGWQLHMYSAQQEAVEFYFWYNLKQLELLIAVAEKYGIKVADKIKESYSQRKAKAERLREAARLEALNKQQEEKREQAKRNWENKCKNGCGNCANLRRWGDDFICEKTGDDLAIGAVLSVYVDTLFNPMPSENCPYKV